MKEISFKQEEFNNLLEDITNVIKKAIDENSSKIEKKSRNILNKLNSKKFLNEKY